MTPEEMAVVDAAATESIETLIERAGIAVAWAARQRLRGTYGKRVAVLVGKGNNGADGRVAAARLRTWGAKVLEVDPGTKSYPPDIDLIVDAAYGTGLSRPYSPTPTTTPVLSVDIASGVSGLTGELLGEPLFAAATVTFQALKPGLILHPGATRCGEIEIVDLGLDTSQSRAHLIGASDVAGWIPERSSVAHKWQAAVWVIGGSPGMAGAPTLAAGAAARVGAGYVRMSVPGASTTGPLEAVGYHLDEQRWSGGLTDIDRFGAVVLGPGLGRKDQTSGEILRALSRLPVPTVVDGDALAAVGTQVALLRSRNAPTVLTPHDGEYERLMGRRPGADRLDAARQLAAKTSCVALLKGPATVVADPKGNVLVSNTGDERLATAGTGDVLAGAIAGLMAQGVPALQAAAGAAWLHGAAGSLSPRHGMVASDLLVALPEVLREANLG